jgi:hypothetical protein
MPNPTKQINVDVSITGDLYANSKFFRITHPINPLNYLQHTSLEGPEMGVYYRGIGETDELGSCIIKLPEYFESITWEERRTVIVTPLISDLGEPLAICASLPKDGQFIVMTLSEPGITQFCWEVKAIRKDQPLEYPIEIKKPS